MSNHPELGKLIDQTAQRDAIHIAIAPVIAVEFLQPGQHIGLVEGNNAHKVGKTCPRGAQPSSFFIGIVDPFLKKPVKAGEWFYMLLYQKTITNLRHDWTHPAFIAAEVGAKLSPSESEEYIRRQAATIGVTYEELIENATRFQKHGDYWNEGSRFESVELDDPGEFWKHFAEVTGIPISEGGSFFSCAC